MIAYAVHETGGREVIGLDLGEVESEAFWIEFLPRPSRVAACTACASCVSDAPRGVAGTRSPGSSPARGSAAPSTSSATCTSTCRPDQRGLVWPRCGRSSTPRTRAQARERARRRSSPACRADRPKVCRAARRSRGRPARVLRVPGRALDEAALHEPARARQPRDRPPHRRRRHLPQRRRRDPPRRRAADRAERRMARQPPLPLRRVARARPRRRGRARTNPRGGPRPPTSLSYTPDEQGRYTTSADLTGQWRVRADHHGRVNRSAAPHIQAQ